MQIEAVVTFVIIFFNSYECLTQHQSEDSRAHQTSYTSPPHSHIDYWSWWEHAVHSLWNTHVFWVSVLGATPNHTPLQYRHTIKISNQLRHIDLIPITCLNTLTTNLQLFVSKIIQKSETIAPHNLLVLVNSFSFFLFFLFSSLLITGATP